VLTAVRRGVSVGSRRLLADHGIELDADDEAGVAALEADGKTVMFVTIDGCLAVAVAVADTVKDHAAITGASRPSATIPSPT